MSMTEREEKLLDAYQSALYAEGTLEDAEEAFRGIYESPEAFAEEFYCGRGLYQPIPEAIIHCIDWRRVAHDFKCDGWTFYQSPEGFYVFAP